MEHLIVQLTFIYISIHTGSDIYFYINSFLIESRITTIIRHFL